MHLKKLVCLYYFMYAHSELPMSIFLSMYLKVLFLNSKEVKTGVLFSSWSLQKRFSLRLSKRYVVYRLCLCVCLFVFFNAWNFYPLKCRLACEVWAFLTTFSFHTALQRERRASCGTVVHLRAYKAGLCRLEQMFVELRPAGLHQDVRWEIWEKGDYRPEEKIYWVR